MSRVKCHRSHNQTQEQQHQLQHVDIVPIATARYLDKMHGG